MKTIIKKKTLIVFSYFMTFGVSCFSGASNSGTTQDTFEILGINMNISVEEFKKKHPNAKCEDIKEFPDPRVFGNQDALGLGVYMSNNKQYEKAGIFESAIRCKYSPDNFKNEVTLKFVLGKIRFLKREYDGIKQNINDVTKTLESRIGIKGNKFDNCGSSGGFDKMWCQQKGGIGTYDYVVFDIKNTGGYIQIKSGEGGKNSNDLSENPRNWIRSLEYQSNTDDLTQIFKKKIEEEKVKKQNSGDKTKI